LITFAISPLLPVATLLMLLSLPLAKSLSDYVNAHHANPSNVSSSKFLAVSLHFWSGLFLGLGCILSQI